MSFKKVLAGFSWTTKQVKIKKILKDLSKIF